MPIGCMGELIFSPLCGYRTVMNNVTPPSFVFAAAGLFSGLGSGLSVVVQPLGIVIPGVLFGVAVSHAIHTSLQPLSSAQRFSLIVISTVAYISAIVASLLSMHLPGIDNGIPSGVILGAIAGGVGAFVVAVSLVIVVNDLRHVSTIIAVSIAGAVFGSLFIIVAYYVSVLTGFGHPFDDVVSFPLWQAGVASVIPVFRASHPLA